MKAKGGKLSKPSYHYLFHYGCIVLDLCDGTVIKLSTTGVREMKLEEYYQMIIPGTEISGETALKPFGKANDDVHDGVDDDGIKN